ncbi:hypothetical protein [Asticcacaulis sp.]|nr:hypothetical protein [Asticcacaulis sp.]HTM83206.1 hypothetical protein [Asticcacaulis sp.]
MGVQVGPYTANPVKLPDAGANTFTRPHLGRNYRLALMYKFWPD